MTELANTDEAVEFFIDSARYGDADDVLIALDEYKVDIDAIDDQKRTALHMASANGHADIVRTLLQRGANPEAANEQSNTPLHWACLNGQEEVVRLLMDAGASPSAINAQGRTPVDEALGRPFQAAVLEVVNSFGKTTDGLDDNDDPEEDVEMEEQETEKEEDPALRPYDKYGNQ